MATTKDPINSNHERGQNDSTLGHIRPRAIAHTHIAQLSQMLSILRRSPAGVSRSALGEALSLGRNAVEQKLQLARELGLVKSGGQGQSTGGRAPEVWQFEPSRGILLVACISYRDSVVAITNLTGQVLARESVPHGILDAPRVTCDALACTFTHLFSSFGGKPWAMAITVPIPVDFKTGRLVDPIALSFRRPDRWSTFAIRRFFISEFQIPVWLEDEVNAMALTAAERPGAPGDLLYVRISLGLGLGIVSGRKVHRGALGISGEIGHLQVDSHSAITCRCGRRGCLETFVSGSAFEEAALKNDTWKRSPYLTRIINEHGTINCDDVFRGIKAEDPYCTRMSLEASARLARVLSVLATTYNPGEIVLGGNIAASGNRFAHQVNDEIRRRVLPTTAARLSVRMGTPQRVDEISGGAHLVLDALLSPSILGRWINQRTPIDCQPLLTTEYQQI